MAKFEEQLKDKTFKMSVADLLRLMQFEREQGHDRPKDVRVSWIEPAEENKS
jgi:hypothetical protein